MLAWLVSPAWADYNDGLRAFNDKDYRALIRRSSKPKRLLLVRRGSPKSINAASWKQSMPYSDTTISAERSATTLNLFSIQQLGRRRERLREHGKLDASNSWPAKT
jgi:hypothetical protein